MPKFTDPEVRKRLDTSRAPQVIDVRLEDGAPLRLAVRLPSEAEIDNARRQAQATIRGWAKGAGYDATEAVDLDPALFERLLQRLLVRAAFFDVDTLGKDKPDPFFPTPDDVAALSATTTEMLIEAYAEHQARMAARRAVEKTRELAESLLAPGPTPSMAGLERSHLIAIVQHLVEMLRTQRS